MANNSLSYDTSIETGIDAYAVLADTGFIEVYTGTQPALNGSITGTLLVSVPLANPAFADSTASGGTVTADVEGTPSATIGMTGTAGYFALLKADDSTVVATGSVGLSGADLNFSSLSLVSGATFTVTSFTISQLQSFT
jgi:hypothetical protein